MDRVRLRRLLPSFRLVGLFVLAGFLPIVLLTWGSLAVAHSALKSEIDTRMEAAVADSRIKVSSELTASAEVATALAQRSDVIDALETYDRTKAQQVAAQLDLARPDWNGLLLVDQHGAIEAADPPATALVGAVLTDPAWTRSGPASRSPYVVGTILRSGSTLVRTVAVVAPVESEDQIVGYLIGLADVATLQSGVDQSMTTGHIGITISDKSGHVIAAPGLSSGVLHTADSSAPIRAALAGRTGLDTIDRGGHRYLVGYGAVPGFGWGISAQLSEHEAYAGLDRLRSTVLWMAGWLMASMLVGLCFAARSERSRRRNDEMLQHRSKELLISERRFRTAFLYSPVGILRLDLTGRIVEANPAFGTLVGRTEAELLGMNVQDITHPDDQDLTARRLAKRDVDGEITRLEKRYVHSDGHTIWVLLETSRLTDIDGEEYFFAQVLDISDRKSAEDALNRQAMHDSLTGLPNRVQLEDRIGEAMSDWSPTSEFWPAVLFVDLDGFKAVNDGLGHRVGDEVLCLVARRLTHIVRPGDTVCRLGGDEFVVLCTGLPSRDDPTLAHIAERIVAAASEPVTVDGETFAIGASVGCAWPSRVGESATSLLSRADEAMYQAKRLGKGRLAFADDSDEPDHEVVSV